MQPSTQLLIASLGSPRRASQFTTNHQPSRQAEDADRTAALALPFEDFAGRYLHIRTKDKRIVPLEINHVQRLYRERRGEHPRNLILKARQFGFSTLTAAEFFWDTLRTPATYSMVVAQDDEAVEGLFQMVKLMYDRLPAWLQPRVKYSNKRQLYFPDLESWYTVGTAGGKSTGRSKTINNLHASEIAYWPDGEQILTGLLEAVPEDGRVVIESTAANYGDYYHQRYLTARRGESSFRAYFFPWFFHPEYARPIPTGQAFEPTQDERTRKEQAEAEHGLVLTQEQLAWHRQKRADNERWASEYPSNDLECFLASGRPRFSREKLLELKAIAQPPRKREQNGDLLIWKGARPGRGYVIGADTAEGTDDGDRCAAYVIDWLTLETVARLWGAWSPSVFAAKLDELGRRYHDALLTVERNNHGHAVLLALEEHHHYPNLYRHEPFDPGTREQNAPRKLGWPANPQTKPIAVARLDEAINSEALNSYDADFVEETIGYVYQPNGSTGAQPGQHDDLVSAMYIALEGHSSWIPPSQQAQPALPDDPWA